MLLEDETITADVISSGLWRFGWAGAHTACHAMRFHPDGRILGYESPNEASWSVEDGVLVVRDTAGAVTTRFDTVLRDDDGVLRLRGRFLGDMTRQIILELERVDWASREQAVTKTRDVFAGFVQDFGWKIGDHSYGSPTLFSANMARLHIGKYTSIAEGCSIALGNHRSDFVSTYPFATVRRAWPSAPMIADHKAKGDVVIGSDVWIAAHVFIGSGVRIGDGAIIAAHSVVTRDVPPYAVVGGNPAKLIRYRFEPDIIADLLAIRWWDWPDHQVDALLPLMLSTDITAFIAAARAAT